MTTEQTGAERIADRLDEIEVRLAKAPQGEYRIALGSGTCVMTGVYVDTEAGTFLAADCCTDDAVKEGYALPDHRPVMEFIAHAPADIAYLVAEVRRLNREMVDSNEADHVMIEALKMEVKHMREVYEAAMIYMETDSVGPLGTSRCKSELFDACRKAREDRG